MAMIDSGHKDLELSYLIPRIRGTPMYRRAPDKKRVWVTIDWYDGRSEEDND